LFFSKNLALAGFLPQWTVQNHKTYLHHEKITLPFSAESAFCRSRRK
jgi:hypothetical protein